MHLLHQLHSQNIAHPPSWLPNATAYLTIMGSEAYGVSNDDSDKDLYGFCLPPLELIFPHLAGEIHGFGTPQHRFEQYQEHHLERDGKSYDFSVFSIVKYFQLCMENNPNMLDSLFTTHTSVLHCTKVGHMVRDFRRQFLHAGCWHKFKGYAYSQLHKMRSRTPEPGSKRDADIQKFGFDRKYAYHLVRLMNEVEQILLEGDLDIQRSREQLKEVRAGLWSLEKVEAYFADREQGLEKAYRQTSLPYKPDEEAIRDFLIQCLREHYGSIDTIVRDENAERRALTQIADVLHRAGVH